MNERRRSESILHYLPVLMITIFLLSTGIIVAGGDAIEKDPSRMVGEEKGSLREIDLSKADLDGLSLNDQDEVVMGSTEGSTREDFPDDSGVTYTENVVFNSRSFEMEHNFRKTYGGSGYEWVNRAIQTSDGGYALVGSTGSYNLPTNDFNLWLLKLDSNGDMLWNRSYGGIYNEDGFGIAEASNGDLIMVGYTTSYGSVDQNAWLLRTDSSGNEIWNKTYNYNNNTRAMSVIETTSGDIAFCGVYDDREAMATDQPFFILADSDGVEIINKTWGTDGDEIARDLIQTSDGEFLLVGDSEPFNGIEEITLWKISATTGEEIWNETYGGRSWYMGYRVAELPNNDIIAFGLVMSMPGLGLDFCLIRTDDEGSQSWRTTYDGGGNENPYSMIVDSLGVTMVGSTSANGGNDAFIVRADLKGAFKWNRYYGGSFTDIGTDVLPSQDGLFLFGHSESWGPGFQSVFVMNLTNNGEAKPGIFRSDDLLYGLTAYSLVEVRYNCGFNIDSSMFMRFSKDGINWYDMSMVQDQYTMLSRGYGSISLQNMVGFEEEFHFEVLFECNSGEGGSFSFLELAFMEKRINGTMETEVITGPDNVRWGSLYYEVDLPQGSSIDVKLRTGSTVEDLLLKDFTGPDGTIDTSYSVGDPIPSEFNGEAFLQVFVNLSIDDILLDPVLKGINLTYDLVGSVYSTALTYDKGDIDDIFNFTLEYTDENGDMPDDVKVEIDGTNETMSFLGPGDVGFLYYLETNLSAGTRSYRFFVDYEEIILDTEYSEIKVLPGPLASIEITPSEVTITTDEEIDFNSTGFDRARNEISFYPLWEVTGGGEIDDFGNFVADEVGTWKVYANDTEVSASADITVTLGELFRIEIVAESTTITADESLQLYAYGYDADGNPIDIEPVWEAEGGTIDQTGLFDGEKVGLWKVYANFSDFSVNVVIGVTPGNLTSIILEPLEVTMNMSQTVQFFARGYDSDGNEVDMEPSWECAGGTIDESGFFMASTAGTWAVYCNVSGISAEAVVIINESLPSGDDDDVDDDDTTDDDDDTSGEDEEDDRSYLGIIIIIVSVVVVLIIIALILFFLLRKKKEEPVAPPTEVPVEEGIPPVEDQEQTDLYGDLQEGSLEGDGLYQEQPQGEYVPEEDLSGGYSQEEPQIQENVGTEPYPDQTQ